MELELGKKYNDRGVIYEVRKDEHGCLGCSCFIKEENDCANDLLRLGPCCAITRKDHQDVIFVQVGSASLPPDDLVIEV